MAFKDQFMWEQVVFSVGKHFMAIDLLLCLAYLQLLPHTTHGLASAPPRGPLKILQRFSEMQNRKNVMLASLTSRRLKDYDQIERSLLISQMSLERTFGTSSVFIEFTLLENEGVPESADPSTLTNEAIHVISCGYEQKTSWGREIGWIYGSVTEDILTGLKMHCREWRSIYCMPLRPAFKGSVPLNLSDRLHQVLWWALDLWRFSLVDIVPYGTVMRQAASNGFKD